jgi:homoserine O-acetyltransferase/O-succinyltransferase
MIVRMLCRILTVACVAAFTLLAADGELQFAELDQLRLVSGEVVAKCRVGYRTYGALNTAKSNAILFPTWFGGRSEALAAFIGADKQLDPRRFHIIAVDALGNGVSCSPSNTPNLPPFTTRDMVNSQHRLLTEKLGIRHLFAVTGISMGGMQTFEWMTAYPDFMDRAIPIIGTPKVNSMDLLLWKGQLTMIDDARAAGTDLRIAMRGVQAMHQFALYTPEYRVAKTPDFAAIWRSVEDGAAKGLDPLDWASQLRAMIAHDATHGTTIERAGASVRARTLVIVATQDHMVNPVPAVEMARAAGFSLVELTGNCGHMAISCEAGKMAAAVADFLAKP